MHSVSRFEIIVTYQEVAKITEVLDALDVPGYSIIRNVVGRGHLGTVSDDINLGSSQLSNVFIICYCSKDKVEPIIAKIKPILNKYGGVSYLFDAIEIRSYQCSV